MRVGTGMGTPARTTDCPIPPVCPSYIVVVVKPGLCLSLMVVLGHEPPLQLYSAPIEGAARKSTQTALRTVSRCATRAAPDSWSVKCILGQGPVMF
eukprot:1403797-Rhodomonas_salina.2